MLEFLEGVKSIDGHWVAELTDFANKRPEEFIVVNHKNNGISFKIQKGPIKEVGKNGCQVTALIEAARVMIAKAYEKYPCRENSITLTKLDEALMWQKARTADREARGVEGTNQA